jgi:hypothetical protein
MALLTLKILEIWKSTKKPLYNVYVNDVILEKTNSIQIDRNKYEAIYNYDGEKINTISIDFLNKESGDTTLKNGKIIDDLFLVINELVIDDINFILKLPKITNYKDVNGKIHRTSTYISFKGVYKIKFHKNLLYTNWLASLI